MNQPEALITADDLPDDLLDDLLIDNFMEDDPNESIYLQAASDPTSELMPISIPEVIQGHVYELDQTSLDQTSLEQIASDLEVETPVIETMTESMTEQEPESVLESPFDTAALQIALGQLQLIQATVTNLTLQAQQSNWQTERARQLLQTSDEMIAGTAASFQSLQESVARATARLATVRLLSQQGSSVIDAIAQFAERTSQLAMNAAITEHSARPTPLTQGGSGSLSVQMRELVDDAEMISSEIAHLLLVLQNDLPQTSQVLAVGTAQLAENWQQVQNSRQQLSQVIQTLANSRDKSNLTLLSIPELPPEQPPECHREDPVAQITVMVTDLQSQIAELQTKLVSVGAAV